MRNELPTGGNVEQPDPLETALAALKPVPGRVDRDRVMYAAGQSAATGRHAADRRDGSARRWVWPALTVLSLLVAVTSAGLYASLLRRPPITRIVYVDRPVRVAPAPTERRAIAAQKPHAAKRQQPVAPRRDGFSSDTEPTWSVSTTTRSRYPILLTNADHLPDSASGGSSRDSSRQSFGKMRRRYTERPERKSVFQRPSSALMFWRQ